jgi:hypothetical protein
MNDDMMARIVALEQRVSELERPASRPAAPAYDAEVFWALTGLKEREPDGGVLYTGAVTLPTGESYEWQHGTPAAQLLDVDWAEAVAELAGTLDALSHPVRLLIVGLVLSGIRSVTDLQEHASLGTSGQLYHHLRQLVAAGWLRTAGRGQYAVPPERVIPLLVILAAARR